MRASSAPAVARSVTRSSRVSSGARAGQLDLDAVLQLDRVDQAQQAERVDAEGDHASRRPAGPRCGTSPPVASLTSSATRCRNAVRVHQDSFPDCRTISAISAMVGVSKKASRGTSTPSRCWIRPLIRVMVSEWSAEVEQVLVGPMSGILEHVLPDRPQLLDHRVGSGPAGALAAPVDRRRRGGPARAAPPGRACRSGSAAAGPARRTRPAPWPPAAVAARCPRRSAGSGAVAGDGHSRPTSRGRRSSGRGQSTAASATAGMVQQPGLDLAELDPVAADLDLVVGAAQELQPPVGRQPAAVAGAVEPAPGAERVGDEPLGGQRRPAEVAAGHPGAGDVQLPGHADRHRPQRARRARARGCSASGPADGTSSGGRDRRPARRPDRRLGRAVHVDQPARPGRRSSAGQRRPAAPRRRPAHGHAGGGVEPGVQQQPPAGRGGLHVRDARLARPARQHARRRPARCPPGEHDPAAGDQRQEQLQAGDVEGQRGQGSQRSRRPAAQRSARPAAGSPARRARPRRPWAARSSRRCSSTYARSSAPAPASGPAPGRRRCRLVRASRPRRECRPTRPVGDGETSTGAPARERPRRRVTTSAGAARRGQLPPGHRVTGVHRQVRGARGAAPPAG